MPKRQQPSTPKRPTTRSKGFGLMPTPEQRSSYDESGERVVDYLGTRKTPETSPYAEYNAVEYVGMCAELCGKGHWDMYFRTVAMTRSSFFQWVEDKKAASMSADADGAQLFQDNCAQCHGQNGKGSGTFPPLAGSQWTSDPKRKKDHIQVVLLGSKAESLRGPTTVKGKTYDGAQMVGHATLNNAEVAAVVNHERTSWGNSGGKVTRKQVAKIRKQLGLEPRPVVEAGGVEPAKLIDQGKQLYEACASCHGAQGKGPKTVPNLSGSSAVIGSVDSLVDTLVNGQNTDKWPGIMTPVGRGMTDREVAALVTYLRQAFGNDASAVQPPEVRRIRKNLK